jgi:hypothetical protein
MPDLYISEEKEAEPTKESVKGEEPSFAKATEARKRRGRNQQKKNQKSI